MEMLGMPLEERKKAYAGKTMQDLVQDYQKAERSRDLPTMIALLDIIKTAPKPKVGPPTTVVQDAMAAVMPPPAPPAQQVPGIMGAVDAMAAQNAPQQLDMPAVMAADGGFMNNGDEEPADGYAKGGPARFFLGGQGTVAPYSSFATLPMADVERMAMMGDLDAQEELNRRNLSRVSVGNRPPGPGIGPTTPQVTDRFGPPGKVPPMPSAATPSAVPTAPMAPTAPATPPTGIRGLINRVAPYVSKGAKITGYGTAASELLRATEANVGEDDMLAKVKVLQELGGSLDPAVREAAQAEALLPRVPLSQWKAKYFPEAAAQDLAPTAKLPDSGPGGRGPGPVMPSLPFNLADYKDKRIEDYITERNQYEAKLGKEKGVRSIKDIQADLEKFRTEAKERATTDKAAAQEAFQQEALLTAALAAPQFLKGRGLGQATARFAETASPGLMGAMQARKSSLKEATKAERDAADKFKLAQLDLDKSYRAEELGKFDKAASLRADGIKTYIQGSLEKYKADMSYAATMGYVDRILAKGLVDAATKRVEGLQLNPEFRKLPPETQQRMIESILRGAVSQGGSQRPKIIDVPGQ
jgi:hypothetical protein